MRFIGLIGRQYVRSNKEELLPQHKSPYRPARGQLHGPGTGDEGRQAHQNGEGNKLQYKREVHRLAAPGLSVLRGHPAGAPEPAMDSGSTRNFTIDRSLASTTVKR